MGYTHYFPHKRSFTPDEWQAVTTAARQIIAASQVPLAFEYNDPISAPQIDADYIRFNGIGDDGHETFAIYRDLGHLAASWSFYTDQMRERGYVFVFCKTAHKPYDVVVTAILSAINKLAPGALDIGSDGGPHEWGPGVALARRALLTQDIQAPALED